MNTKRAVIYARVSSDDLRAGKERRNLDEQIKMGRDYAQSKGYTVVAELAEDDRGASGASLDLQQLNRVFSMARAGEYDVLVVREMDRLSRRLAKQLIIEDELKRDGVEIEYVLATYADNPEGNLSKQIKAVISEYERLKIAERMTRGRRVKARTGSIICHGHAPYGYDACVKDGKITFIINPKEAEIVQLVFNWYVQGMTIHEIQRELTRMAIPTPADRDRGRNYHKLRAVGEWGRSTIHLILQNENYMGVWHYGKRSPRTPSSKQLVYNDPKTWIKVQIPAIVSPELWEASRRIRAKNKAIGGGNVKNDYLLRGHVACGHCEARMTAESSHVDGKHYFYYRCRGQRVEARHNDCSYPAKIIDEIAWAWVKQLLLNPEAIGQGLAAYRREQEASAGPITLHITTIDRILIENRAALQRLLDLYLSGEFHRDMLIDKKNELEKTIQQLEGERAGLLARLEAQNISEEQEQILIEFAGRIAKGLDKADANFKIRRGIIETLRVEVILVQEDGMKTLRIKCILGDEGYYVLSPPISIALDAIHNLFASSISIDHREAVHN
jgi:site-specific DNA recombinase